jgi:LysM repeat protein
MAPLALLVALAAVGYVVTSSTRDDEGSSSGGSSSSSESDRTQTSTRSRTSTARTQTAPSEPRTYTVQSGDTLGTISEETGVPVETLLELNPELDPQSLNVGDSVRLRR